MPGGSTAFAPRRAPPSATDRAPAAGGCVLIGRYVSWANGKPASGVFFAGSGRFGRGPVIGVKSQVLDAAKAD
jgi:hypothetical protein